jgi:hypothetical protein
VSASSDHSQFRSYFSQRLDHLGSMQLCICEFSSDVHWAEKGGWDRRASRTKRIRARVDSIGANPAGRLRMVLSLKVNAA